MSNSLPCNLLRGDKTRILGTKENWVDIFACWKAYISIFINIIFWKEFEVQNSPSHCCTQWLFRICSYCGFQFTDRETETWRSYVVPWVLDWAERCKSSFSRCSPEALSGLTATVEWMSDTACPWGRLESKRLTILELPGCGTRELAPTAGGNVKWQDHFKKQSASFLKKVKHTRILGLNNSALWDPPERGEIMCSHKGLYLNVQRSISHAGKHWKPFKCKHKLEEQYNGILLSNKKGLTAETFKHLDKPPNHLLSERSQLQRLHRKQ